MANYKDDFFEARDDTTRRAAETILGIVTEIIPPVRSAVDIGCGVGTWLSVLQAMGAREVLGIDGPWVNTERLVIDRDAFWQRDLSGPLTLPRRYDLAISLEVAEHLPARRAAGFVEVLTAAADFVLFSAAIPYQGGRGHVNEQWPDYWSAHFADRLYRPLDIVRNRIWDDSRIPSWYRQNTLLFVAEPALARLASADALVATGRLARIHPETYDKLIRKGPWKLFRKAMKHSLRNIFAANR